MSLTKRFNLISKYMRVILACFFGNYYHTYFRLTARIMSSKLLLMIDLCNKKILVCAFPWKILKNFAGIRQSPTICTTKCSEQSALNPHENTQFVQNPNALQQAQVWQDFSLDFLTSPFPSCRSSHGQVLSGSLLAFLVYFTSLLLLYLLPSSPHHLPTLLVCAAYCLISCECVGGQSA